MKKARTRSTISRQITRPMILFIIVLMLFNAFFLFFHSLRHSIRDRFKRASQLGETAAREVEEYRSLSFLIPYWQEHYDSMDLLYDETGLFEEKEKILSRKITDEIELRLVTGEEVEALDEEGQKLFAEICYNRMCDTFDFLKQIYHPNFLTFFTKKGDRLFFYVTGTMENELHISEGGQIFELGSTDNYKEGVYPILDEILQTGQPSSSLELSLKRGADSTLVHYFYPVYSGREMVGAVGVSVPWRNLIMGSITPSVGVLVVSVILLMLVVMRSDILLRERVIDPLLSECEIIERYRKDKDSGEAGSALEAINCGNEIELIADNMSEMVREISRYVEEIRANTTEKERLNTELELAARIQEDMIPDTFPAFPGRREFDVYASMTPAKEVGGDFYNFFLTDEDHLCLVIADVSGKGIPAALFMMMVTTIMHNSARSGMSPSEVLRAVNEQLCENNQEKMFVTAWMGILDLKTGIVRAANAGHEYPILSQPGGDFELIKDRHSFVLGGMDGVEYREYELKLQPGARLFLYTDGVPEAANAGNEMFGVQRTLEVLNSAPEGTPCRLLENVEGAVREFVEDAPQFDDLTMLCIQYFGKDMTPDESSSQ